MILEIEILERWVANDGDFSGTSLFGTPLF
jgi:hypothetical protein